MADGSGGELSGSYFDVESFDGADWAEALIEHADFETCVFTDVVFRGARIKVGRFADCTFVNCDLSLVEPADTIFTGCTFRNSRMVGMNWTLTREEPHRLHGAHVYEGCDISLSDFTGLDLRDVEFTECRAKDVMFREAKLVNSSFNKTDLAGADFAHADLSGARLVDAIGVSLDPRVTTLDGAIVSPITAMQVVEALGIVVETDE
ncbi:hypothetical protein MNBD_ACTINO02-2717 [hydrothermal vent metagenome]|uniref:Pentapeptide repeat family protein n=1 Tax=hydrothermal vent metagenome TaxID=652676 RepID=A0A3B0SCR1_9ZZZZ